MGAANAVPGLPDVSVVRDAVPVAMRELSAWLLWKRIRRDGRWVKKPYCADGLPRTDTLDSSQDRARMVSFDQAAAVYDAHYGEYAGLGVALGPVPGTEIHLSGIDLDDIAADDPRVVEIMSAANSYAEVSPSQQGIKIFGTGSIGTARVAAADGGLEIYSGGRFFTVTGQRINDADLADLTDAAAVARKLWRTEMVAEKRTTSNDAIPEGGRNSALTSLAGAMRRNGASVAAIEAGLLAHNAERCNPPVTSDEVRSIARSIGRYEPVAARAEQADTDLTLLSFDVAALLGPIEPERELLPGVPCEAYTLVAGGLASAKTTLLHMLQLARATGYDLLNLTDTGIPPGPTVLVSYEDADRRIFRRFQILVQDQYQSVLRTFGERAANDYLALVGANVRRVTLTGKSGTGIVCRGAGGNVVPNHGLLDELIGKVQQFAAADVLIGLDPLRLAIVGSQSDDDGADVVVHVLNDLAGRLPNSALIVPSHTTKSGAIEPGRGHAAAAYSTSGSALYSQHARSNFLMSRLPPDEIRATFYEQVTTEEADQQRVVQLTHARLSHGPESRPRFYVMRNGVLVPVRPNANDMPLAEMARRALPAVQEAIADIVGHGHTVSRKALEGVTGIARTRKERREYLDECLQQGWLREAGNTSNKRIELTDAGRAQLSPSNHGESGREAA
jgi:hypothetical protein